MRPMETIDLMIKWLNLNQGVTSALLAAAMVLITAVYVVATIYLVRLTNKQLQHAIAIEAQRTRPHVVFEIVANSGAVTASLRNLGQTSARNLKIRTEPELKCLLGGEKTTPRDEKEESMPFTAHVMACLAPGREITGFVAFWDRFSEYYPSRRFTCVLTYEGPNGERYVESSELDLAGYSNLKTLKVKGMPEVAANLEKISESLSRIGRGLDSPLVRVIDEAEHAKKQAALLDQVIQELEKLKEQGRNSEPSV